MFFFERNIVKQITNAGGLYLRYIDDMFIIINWPERHLNKQIDQWNTLDSNIQLKAQAGSAYLAKFGSFSTKLSEVSEESVEVSWGFL
ncbi:unnamed protein product [Rotaria magnacalcarata]|uniref:Reverse transcriptase domain-containing protein n=1 Tax=Rotaria magnacalcarata TaxID=392030 RepID=A0A820P1E0_9BILA|nr:unnamed protein product [Rotaria magnacalcarata]